MAAPPVYTNNVHLDFQNPGMVIVHYGSRTAGDPAAEVHTKLVFPVEFYRQMVAKQAGQLAKAETDEALARILPGNTGTGH